MRMTDLIAKKRDGQALTTEEIQYMIADYTAGIIPDYQMSSMCMAILLRGMDDREVLDLTLAMQHSGDVLDLSPIEGIKADKHSTGGVGDKTSLVLCPMVAACGLKIAKMSGRGLGHTGGTIDKLESFPGFSTALTEEQFFENVNRHGIAIMGQTANLVPADKKLYALRDVTGTVPSIPLIVSSIMSKKLASGADVIVLDVKCGDGSFMKTPEDAEELARNLTRIGRLAGKKCAAIITDMDQPLGFASPSVPGSGQLHADRGRVCPRPRRRGADAAGGRELRPRAGQAGRDGPRPGRRRIRGLPARASSRRARGLRGSVAEGSMKLGGGRATKEDVIDPRVGVVLHKKLGDTVAEGESLAAIHAADEKSAAEAARQLLDCYELCDGEVVRPPFIRKILRGDV